jgi:DNA-binding NarL/FixJ family response regulator
MDLPSHLRVLVIDPAPMVAEAIAAALDTYGLSVVRAAARKEAEDLILGDHIDVLICHGHLPGDLRPCQFAAEVAVARPLLAIVVVSAEVGIDATFAPGRASLLQKPFDLKTLLFAIAEARRAVIQAA